MADSDQENLTIDEEAPVQKQTPKKSPKKGRGRPKKPSTDDDAPDVEVPKKGRGRPKNPSTDDDAPDAEVAKKGRGRPAGKTKPRAPVENDRPKRKRVNVVDIQYYDEPEEKVSKQSGAGRKPKGGGRPKGAKSTKVEGRKMIGKVLHYKVGTKWLKVYECDMKEIKKWEKANGEPNSSDDQDSGSDWDDDDDSSDEFEVEKITKEKLFYSKVVYLVRWKGFKSDSDTWEPAEQFKGSPKILAAWEKTKQEREEKRIEKTIQTNERRAEKRAALDEQRRLNPPKQRGRKPGSGPIVKKQRGNPNLWKTRVGLSKANNESE